MKTHFDYIVIGGGSAGYSAARTAREYTDKVAIIDNSDELGGLCIRKGCMPSKTVIYSAEVLHHAQKADKFGLTIPGASVDMPALLQRKRTMVEDFAEYRVKSLESNTFTLFRNRAEFINETTLRLDDGTKLTADFFMISTGSAVNWPNINGLGPEQALTSDEILELDFLPESIIVLGGGIVASELAQYLNRIGTRVTMIQRSDRILKEFDSHASDVVEKAFRDEGIDLYTGTRLRRITHSESGSVCVDFDHGSEMITVEAGHLFNALGRHPNTSSLGLEAAGVKLRPSGHIQCNEFMQTSNPRIYAAGDVAGPDEIVHIAVKQGMVAAKHAYQQKVRALSYDFPLYVIFTDPQVAFSGMSEGHLRSRHIPSFSASYSFDDHGKSILMEANYGHVRVIAEMPTGRIMGAECVGKDAGELIHALNVAIGLKATVFDLLQIDWYHPTLSEIWEYPLEEIADRIKADHPDHTPDWY